MRSTPSPELCCIPHLHYGVTVDDDKVSVALTVEVVSAYALKWVHCMVEWEVWVVASAGWDGAILLHWVQLALVAGMSFVPEDTV